MELGSAVSADTRPTLLRAVPGYRRIFNIGRDFRENTARLHGKRPLPGDERRSKGRLNCVCAQKFSTNFVRPLLAVSRAVFCAFFTRKPGSGILGSMVSSKVTLVPPSVGVKTYEPSCWFC